MYVSKVVNEWSCQIKCLEIACNVYIVCFLSCGIYIWSNFESAQGSTHNSKTNTYLKMSVITQDWQYNLFNATVWWTKAKTKYSPHTTTELAEHSAAANKFSGHELRSSFPINILFSLLNTKWRMTKWLPVNHCLWQLCHFSHLSAFLGVMRD